MRASFEKVDLLRHPISQPYSRQLFRDLETALDFVRIVEERGRDAYLTSAHGHLNIGGSECRADVGGRLAAIKSHDGRMVSRRSEQTVALFHKPVIELLRKRCAVVLNA